MAAARVRCAGERLQARVNGTTMDDTEFWSLISKLDWSKVGDDAAVCEPVVAALASKPASAITEFESTLAKKLHALDTEAIARQIGDDSYVGPDEHFSVDAFLYARCVVVANGQSLFTAVLSDHREMAKDMEFEALLGIAAAAYQRKTGQEFAFVPDTDYETFSNREGWN